MNSMENIQEHLNNKVKRKVESEWEEALKKASKLIEPYIMKLNQAEKEAFMIELREKTVIRNCWDLYIGINMKVPEAYMDFRKKKAAEEFVAKVAEIQKQFDRVYQELID